MIQLFERTSYNTSLAIQISGTYIPVLEQEIKRQYTLPQNSTTAILYAITHNYYDTLGNRTKETTVLNGVTEIKEYSYNDRYQLTEIKTDGQTTDTYTYNQRGAIKTHNNKTYSYNVWDKISSVTDGEETHNFVYDTNGIRTQKDNTRYVVDKNNNVIAEADADGNITAETVWGHQPLARKANGSWYYYIYNAHGDVIGLVSDSGEVVNSYQYDAWGNIVSETETIDNPIKYAGEYYDDELSMYYLRARYYDPQIGRFTSYDIEDFKKKNNKCYKKSPNAIGIG